MKKQFYIEDSKKIINTILYLFKDCEKMEIKKIHALIFLAQKHSLRNYNKFLFFENEFDFFSEEIYFIPLSKMFNDRDFKRDIFKNFRYCFSEFSNNWLEKKENACTFDLDEFSKNNLNSLDFVLKWFGKLSYQNIRNIIKLYPEYSENLNFKIIKIFKNPNARRTKKIKEILGEDPFFEDKKQLKEKAIYFACDYF